MVIPAAILSHGRGAIKMGNNTFVNDDTIPNRIDTLLKGGTINAWETNFLTSIKGSWEKYHSLTEGQYDTLLAIESRNSELAIEQRQKWVSEWNEEKRNKWNKMIAYYSKSVYYTGSVLRVKKDPNYIPSQKEYESVACNKYALRYLQQLEIPPKFHVGQLTVYREYGSRKLATIVLVGEIVSWAKGSREYTIYLTTTGTTYKVLEKELTYYRPSLDKKITLTDDVPF